MGRWNRYGPPTPSRPYRHGPQAHIVEEDYDEGTQGFASEHIFTGLNNFFAIKNVGQFCHFRKLTLPNPGVSFQGFGPLGQPTNSITIDALKKKKLLKLAPFGETTVDKKAKGGRKKATKKDKEVRDTWEADVDKFQLLNADNWGKFVAEQIGIMLEDFTLDQPTRARTGHKLYKLLVYEKGGHFKVHKDTEKEQGMFATVSFVLPSVFKGGNLEVHHNGTTKIFEPSLHSSGVDTGSILGWYADLDHEVKPVTSGMRICLVYNVFVRPPSPDDDVFVPSPPISVQDSMLGLNLARQVYLHWALKDSTWKFFYLLDHVYSAVGLAQFGLKRRDKLAEMVLREICTKYHLEMEMVEIEVTGEHVEEDPCCDTCDATAKSETFGHISISNEEILQPASINHLGTFTPQGYAGNYEPGDEQEYHGRALMLFIPPAKKQSALAAFKEAERLRAARLEEASASSRPAKRAKTKS